MDIIIIYLLSYNMRTTTTRVVGTLTSFYEHTSSYSTWASPAAPARAITHPRALLVSASFLFWGRGGGGSRNFIFNPGGSGSVLPGPEESQLSVAHPKMVATSR